MQRITTLLFLFLTALISNKKLNAQACIGNNLPTINSILPTTVCATNPVTLTASTNTNQVKWYIDNNLVYTDNTPKTIAYGVTVAGGNGSGTGANQLNRPLDFFITPNGDLYVADTYNHRIQKFAAGSNTGVTIAGGYGSGASQFNSPSGIAVDAAGNIYVSDSYNYRIQKFAPGSSVGITVAGGNGYGNAANQLNNPYDIFVDANGNIYVADAGNDRIQKFSPGSTNGVTVAGDNGRGSAANQLAAPGSIFVDKFGNIYTTEIVTANRIQKWAPGATTGVTVAGGNYGSANNQLASPWGIYVDSLGNLFVCDQSNHRIQKFVPGSTTGITIAGGNGGGNSSTQLQGPTGVLFDGSGNMYICDGNNNNRIQKWVVTGVSSIYTPTTNGFLTALASTVNNCTANSSAVTVNALPVANTTTISTCNNSYTWNNKTYTQSGKYLFNTSNAFGCINADTLYLTIGGPTIKNVSANAICAGRPVTVTASNNTAQIQWKLNGNLVSTDNNPQLIPTTQGSTVAGGNGYGNNANQFTSITGVAIDASGNIYVCDQYNNRIQKWTPGATSGTTVAGGNGYGSNANQLANPKGIAVDAIGNIYVADQENNRVQKWTQGATSGTTVAGGSYGNGPSELYYPNGVAVDASGNIYVSDQYNNRVQKWAQGATSGTTVAGGYGYGSSANQLAYPYGVAVDGSGNVYVCDQSNNRIQKWTPGATSGSTVAGGTYGNSASQLYYPNGVAVDFNGNIYVSDQYNNRIQKWTPGATAGTTVAGGNGYGSNNNQLTYPFGVAADANGNIYVADANNYRIQKWDAPNVSSTYNIANAGILTAVVSTSGNACSTTSATITVSTPNSTSGTQNITACDNYYWNGNIYTTNGTYTFNTTNASGCDSTATLNLTIKHSSSTTTTITACGSYTWNGVTYTASGTYTKTGLTNSAGCDSILTLKLTINQSPATAVITANSTTSFCRGGSVNLSVPNNISVPATGLVGYWKFDETSGDSVTDNSGNNLTGNFVGSVGRTSSNAFTGASKAVTLNTSSYINVPDNSVFNSMQNNFTIESWIYLDGTKTDNTIVDRGSYNFLFQAQAYGYGLGFYNQYDGWSFSYESIPNNTWVHVACTWDQSTNTLIFYKNGVQINSFYRNTMYFDAGDLNIGRQDPNGCQCNYFPGNMDELRLWNVTRTPSQIAASYASSVSTVGGSSTYSWSPSTGLNTSTSSSITASPNVTTTYTVTETAINGCTATSNPITVTINSNSSISNINICSSALPYSWNGVNYTASGTYTKSGLTNSKGCDSIATLNLTIKQNYTITASTSSGGTISNNGNTTVCQGNNQSYTITPNIGYKIGSVIVNGINVGLISSYTFSNVNSNNSISVTFELLCVNTSSTTNITTCNNYTWNGITYNLSGTYTKNGLINVGGCDSSATLILTINTPTISYDTTNVCFNQLPYTWNGLIFSSAGTLSRIITNSKGCDSTIFLTVLVGNPVTPSILISGASSVCSNASATFTASTTNEGAAPIFQWRRNGGNIGSGSIITIPANTLLTNDNITCVLTANNACQTSNTATSNNIKVTINAAPIVPKFYNGNVLIANNTLTYCTIGNQNTMYTTVAGGVWSSSNPSVVSVSLNTVAADVTTNSNGTANINYRITATNGCSESRSVAITVAKQDAPNPISGESSICVGDIKTYSTTSNGGVWSISGRGTINTSGVANYTSGGTTNIVYTITNASGCSATAILPITINTSPSIPNIAFAAGNTVNPMLGAPSGSMCRNRTFNIQGFPAGGSWASTGVISINSISTLPNSIASVSTGSIIGTGSLSYIVSNNTGCSSRRTLNIPVVACATKTITSELLTNNNFTIFPNPAKDVFNIKFNRLTAGTIVITDVYGKTIHQQPINKLITIINNQLSKGLYFVSVITDSGREIKKIVVE